MSTAREEAPELAGPAAFDPCGPLPAPGITVLEASAGTGKTYTLTSLVTRFVAEGVPLGTILAVTFTRMATGELRDRVRQRLVAAEEHLGRLLKPGAQAALDDEVVSTLADAPRPSVSARRDRLADAVAGFDAATITTTHGFCQLILEGLGSAGDVAPGVELLEDPADLVEQVVDDLYLRYALREGMPPFTRAAARAAALKAVANPDIVLAPPPGEGPSGLLSRLALRARAEVARRLQEANLLTYDQLLARLADALEDPERGAIAGMRLRRRYRVVLVDEFQDTDPIQWRILRTAFGGGSTTLVLVGDPKQAIYSFRGADVQAYLQAADKAITRTLTRSWRADQGLLDATDALLSPLQLGHPAIRFRPVSAARHHQQAGGRRLPVAAPLRVRIVSDHQRGVPTTPSKGLLQKTALTDWIAGDAARDVARLLASGAEVLGREPASPGAAPAWRSVSPADVAVLTRTNKQSTAVRDALRAAGVPSVVAGLDSVFASEAARDWLSLLEALQEPASRPRAVALALTCFVGMSAAEVAAADERRWEAVHARTHRWSAVLADHGIAALYRWITGAEGLPARVLATEGGERLLTDLGHVAQLLHGESAGSQMGAPTLRAWLAQRIRDAGEEQADAEERSRRLDSDAEAVQVLTVHRAKGLEFGIVLCPFLWDPSPACKITEPHVFHDPENEGRRTLCVGARRVGEATPDDKKRLSVAQAEQRGEDLRLMYVALTRARHQVVLWWGRAQKCQQSPLGRLLMCRDLVSGAVGDPSTGEPKESRVRTALEALAARGAPGLISLEEAGGPAPPAPGMEAVAPLDAARRPVGSPSGDLLEAAHFGRVLDSRWRRSSYTSITAAAHAEHPGAGRASGSEPEDPGISDEPVGDGNTAPLPDGADPPSEAAVASPLGGMPRGAEVGTFVHRVLEGVDFAAPDLEAQLVARAPAADPARWLAGLATALTTPLGPLLPGVSLRDVGRGDRLDEMGFELPVAGGDQPVGEVTTEAIAGVLTRHLPEGSRLAGYPARLADPLLATRLRGYLTGSLDLVFRRVTPEGAQRWYVADYKTNWLGDEGRSLTAWHYRPAALEAEMQRRHYPLQALLYLVALHRYLGWRLRGYDPYRHLGGVLYLFLRGMVGPGTPVVDGEPCGVFSWAPPPALVIEISSLLQHGQEP